MKFPTFIYIGANSVGWFFYVFFLVKLQRQMNAEERTAPDFGDNLYLLGTAVPLLLGFLVVNIVWGILALKRVFPCREPGAGAAWTGVVTVWVAVYLVMRYLP